MTIKNKNMEVSEKLEININSDNPEVAEYLRESLKDSNSFLIEGVIFGNISNTEFKGEEVDVYCNIVKNKPLIKVRISNIPSYHSWDMNPDTGKCTLEY